MTLCDALLTYMFSSCFFVAISFQLTWVFVCLCRRRLTASDCLSHKWLRRKPIVRPAELDTSKDNLKSVVERWNGQPTSPTVVIVIPPDEPVVPTVLPSIIVEDHVPLKVEENVPSKVDNNLPPTNPPVESVNPAPDVNKIDAKPEEEKLPKKNSNLKIKTADDKGTLKQKPTPKGQKNSGDLESPSPSKQPKVELKPVKSKGLVHNQTLPNIPASPVEASTKSLADSVKIEVKDTKFNSSKTNTNEENKVSKFTLKPSSSVPNVINSRIQSGKTEINISKILTQSVKPKIAGIVLGQSTPITNEKSPPRNIPEKTNSSLPKENGPKVITHKIIVEGRTDQPKNTSNLNFTTNKGVQKTVIPAPFSESTLKPTTKPIPITKNTLGDLQADKIERRASDFSCFLHDTESPSTAHLADEIKNLSARLIQMSSQHKSLDEDNNNTNHTGNMYNDPIRQFLANHGVVTRRPKHRITNLNRDVPIGSPPPPSNFSYLVSHCPPSSSRLPWVKQYSPEIHSAPQSPRASPSRYPEGVNKDVILRFDKLEDTSTSVSSSSSIDSLVNYFKTANESQKKATPAK